MSVDHAGWSQHAIAKEVGCSKTTVLCSLKDYDYDTFIAHKKHPGPTYKTLESDNPLLIRIAKKHYNLPFHDITNIAGLPISLKTVARRCKEVQLVSQYARRKPHFISKHKKDRLEWVMKYKD